MCWCMLIGMMGPTAPENGYPVPGKQNITPQDVMTQMFFVGDEE